WSAAKPSLIDGEGVGVGDDDCALNDVLQLPDVTWPVVRLKQSRRLFAESPVFFAGAVGEAMNEVLDEQWDIRPTLTQGRDFQRKHVEPVEQVRAKHPVPDCRLQVTIRRGNDPDIHADRAAAARSLELALLQHAEKHDLGVGGQLANLVEKERPAVGELEAALSPLQGSRKRPLLVAEELGGDE